MMQDQILPDTLWQWVDEKRPLFMVDVRTHEERQIAHLGGHHIPMAELAQRVHEIPHDLPIVLYCRSGARSQAALEYLKSLEYTEVYNLIGGILACEQSRIKSD